MQLKKYFYVFFGLSLLFASGCLKKGEEDPFISIKTRKARITGEWKLVSGEMSVKFLDTTITWTHAGSKMKVKLNEIFLGEYAYFETLSIDKKGKYNQARTEDGDVYAWEGNWYFGGTNKDLGIKNKETITFIYSERSTPSDRYSYVGLNANYVYYIERLTDKDLVIEMQYSYYNMNGIVETIDEHWEYEKNQKK